ncbi:MAG: PEP-CTERM sorting domain-containing protein, partial [Opitutae bacterium]|nr:PEP-CTERM sorting domain-containing protein [Opitutae bacterium]
LEPADPATTPGIVPEPGTLGLLLIGAPLLLAARRRNAARVSRHGWAFHH